MRNNMNILPIVALLLLFSACSSIDCSTTNLVRLVMQLKTSAGKDTTLIDTLSITASRTTTGGNDTTLINRQTKTASVQLPIGYITDVDTFSFLAYDTAQNEKRATIRIVKTNTPYFEGPECAARYHHTITSAELVDGDLITDVTVTNPTINNVPTTNILLTVAPAQ